MCVLLHLLICTALRAHIIVVEALYKMNYYYYWCVCVCRWPARCWGCRCPRSRWVRRRPLSSPTPATLQPVYPRNFSGEQSWCVFLTEALCVCQWVCACKHVCVCVHAGVCVSICVCVCMRACLCKRVRVCMRACMCKRVCACMCVRVCVRACMHACVYTCVCVHPVTCVCVCSGGWDVQLGILVAVLDMISTVHVCHTLIALILRIWRLHGSTQSYFHDVQMFRTRISTSHSPIVPWS